MKPIVLIFTLILFVLLLLNPVISDAKLFKRKTVLMGTDVEIIVSASDEAAVNAAIDTAVMEIKSIEGEMSEWGAGSTVSIINEKAGKGPVKVSDRLFNVISTAQKISDMSGGAFDISWAAMRGLWNFTNGKEHIPLPDKVQERLKLVNYRDIILDKTGKTIFLKREGMAMGLGGIAKGYAVDMAMQALVNHGFKNAIIKAGGDIRVQGTKEGRPWKVSIKHPRDKNKLLGRLSLSNISISTSGDYERFFIKDGIRYHHIMDPKTGYPAQGCQSVTILAPDTMTSDLLSTTVFVLGPEVGMKLIKRLPGIEGIIVDNKGDVHYSSGIRGL
ncbi:MAG: FAD:protein FMN transferase [Thermodesulfobacteriota bacterium]